MLAVAMWFNCLKYDERAMRRWCAMRGEEAEAAATAGGAEGVQRSSELLVFLDGVVFIFRLIDAHSRVEMEASLIESSEESEHSTVR